MGNCVARFETTDGELNTNAHELSADTAASSTVFKVTVLNNTLPCERGELVVGKDTVSFIPIIQRKRLQTKHYEWSVKQIKKYGSYKEVFSFETGRRDGNHKYYFSCNRASELNQAFDSMMPKDRKEKSATAAAATDVNPLQDQAKSVPLSEKGGAAGSSGLGGLEHSDDKQIQELEVDSTEACRRKIYTAQKDADGNSLNDADGDSLNDNGTTLEQAQTSCETPPNNGAEGLNYVNVQFEPYRTQSQDVVTSAPKTDDSAKLDQVELIHMTREYPHYVNLSPKPYLKTYFELPPYKNTTPTTPAEKKLAEAISRRRYSYSTAKSCLKDYKDLTYADVSFSESPEGVVKKERNSGLDPSYSIVCHNSTAGLEETIAGRGKDVQERERERREYKKEGDKKRHLKKRRHSTKD